MSQTDTTSLSELLHAIQLSLQPYRGTVLPESPFENTLDGNNDHHSHKLISDLSRRDSGISVGSNTSPHLKSGEFGANKPSQFGNVTPPLSRNPTLHHLDTKITSHPLLSQTPASVRHDSPSQHSHFSNLSSPRSVKDDKVGSGHLNRMMSDRKLQASTPIVTAPQFSARKGCFLAQNCSIEAGRFRAVTDGGLHAWWCQYDNLVVFDGMDEDSTGEHVIKTRSSKGLIIANRRGKEEIINVQLDCGHCRDILGLTVWKYAVKVTKRGVCKVCRARCKEFWHRSLLLLDDNQPVWPAPSPEPESAEDLTESDPLLDQKDLTEHLQDTNLQEAHRHQDTGATTENSGLLSPVSLEKVVEPDA